MIEIITGIYIDGNLDGSGSISSHSGSLYNGEPLDIGVDLELGNHFLDGKLDGISFWNYTLSVDDINSNLYSLSGNEENLISLWNFNEGSGTTLTDQTSNGNNGTINGATWSTDVPTFSRHLVYENVSQLEEVFALDLDSDGDNDIMSATISGDNLRWFENKISDPFYSHMIANNISYARDIHSSDIDGDGDMDILTVYSEANKVIWYENDGGQGFGVSHVIDDNLDGTSRAISIDFDNDGDIDILASAQRGDVVYLYDNNGSQSFTKNLVGVGDGPSTVVPADLDGDGDLDVVSALLYESKLVWYKNNGSMSFSLEQIDNITTTVTEIGDVDLDGDKDIVVTLPNHNGLGWYENNGSGSFTMHEISNSLNYPSNMKLIDFNSDEYLDILLVDAASNKLILYENNQLGDFNHHSLIASGVGYARISVIDFDQDGDQDFVLGNEEQNQISWFENIFPLIEDEEQSSPNHSLSFDGVDDWIGYSSSYSFENNMTFQAWIKPDGNGDYNQEDAGACIYSQGAQESVSYADFAVGLRTNFPNSNGNLRLVAEFGSANNVVSDVTNLPTDSWTNVAVTYNSGNVNFYVNGALTSTSSVGINTLSNSNSNVFTGRRMSNNAGSFPGEIDELVLWGNVLTSDQIQSHMNAPLSGNEAGLVGYWNFNEGEGSTLTDLSGNGNHGTINGATWSDDGAPVEPQDTIATITLSEVDTYIFPGYIGDTALVAVNADLGDIDLYSSEMHFTGFQGVLGFEGIVTDGTPMGDADWNVIVNEQEEVLITGNYGSDAISGDVTLFYLQFSIADNLEEAVTPIEVAHIELNEEEGLIETFDGSVSVGHLLFGDVTLNEDVSMMDAANVLRYLVGSIDFDKYQMLAADVTLDASVSALDASVIAQNAVGLVSLLPHSDDIDNEGDLMIDPQFQYQPGEIVEVPLMLTNGDNLLSFEVDLSYDPSQVTVEGIEWSDLIDHYMIEENIEPGSIRVAGSGMTPDSQDGVFATISLRVLEAAMEDEVDLTINKMRVNESDPIEDVVVSITQEVLSTDTAPMPTVYALHQNYPNPFNPTTKISYDLPEVSVVTLSIYDLMGREIRTMVSSEQTAGFKNIQWNATDNMGHPVSAGVYIYTIQAGEFRSTKKMLLLK